MIRIVMGNGKNVYWKKEEYTEYKYDGKCFIIIKDDEWIGIYNIDAIKCVVVKK